MKQGQQAGSQAGSQTTGDNNGMLGAGTDPALGTRLTAQALRESPASSVLLNIPPSALGGPPSPDLEVRLHGEQPPAPSLMDEMKSGWNTFAQKARMAWAVARGQDPYAQPRPLARAEDFYRPGHDAASMQFGSKR